MARDLGYRRNQWPAGVTMVQVDRRFAALRIRPRQPAELRRDQDGPWVAMSVAGVSRAWRPWVLRVRAADGATVKVRPFLAGEAGLADCGSRVGGIGSSQPLGNDPVSAVVAVIAIAFYVLVSPFFLAANIRRAKAATRLREALRPSGAQDPAGPGVRNASRKGT